MAAPSNEVTQEVQATNFCLFALLIITDRMFPPTPNILIKFKAIYGMSNTYGIYNLLMKTILTSNQSQK